MLTKKHILLILGIAALMLSCRETIDFYLGVPLQPSFEEDNHLPGLNIFGVIRPDSTRGINNSFVIVHEVAPAINNTPDFLPDSMIVPDAMVTISNESNTQISFTYSNPDSIFNESRYRPAGPLMVIPGAKFTIMCSTEELPVITSTTIVPNQPKMAENSLKITPSGISFELESDTSIYLYEVFLSDGKTNPAYARIIPERNIPTPVSIQTNTADIQQLAIYAYDNNLASYYLLSNTHLNFNKYRKKFGNIENGYGVFGSLNFVLYNLN